MFKKNIYIDIASQKIKKVKKEETKKKVQCKKLNKLKNLYQKR